MKIRAIYNHRKPNGDVSDIACGICKSIGAAYIELDETLVCQGCLDRWTSMINEVILQDVMDSVQRRKEWDKCLEK